MTVTVRVTVSEPSPIALTHRPSPEHRHGPRVRLRHEAHRRRRRRFRDPPRASRSTTIAARGQPRALRGHRAPDRANGGRRCSSSGCRRTPTAREHPVGRLARRFAQRLQGRFGIPVALVDERLTSRDAEAGAARRPARAARASRPALDAVAAQRILEAYFASARRVGSRPRRSTVIPSRHAKRRTCPATRYPMPSSCCRRSSSRCGPRWGRRRV